MSNKYENPFKNDPFSVLHQAYKNLFNKPFEAQIMNKGDDNDIDSSEGYGYTMFPDNHGDPIEDVPRIVIYGDYPTAVQLETLAHEFAHIAAGLNHGHDSEWEAAFDAIKNEYDRLFKEWLDEGSKSNG